MSNSLYLELLDGEYLKVASGHNVKGEVEVYQSIERYLKIMALFGYQISLSDIQTIDSGLWLDLWKRPSFRDFLSENPTYLTLRSRPIEHAAASPFTQTMAGLNRTQDPVWTSSAFGDVKRVKDFAALILQSEKSIEEFEVDRADGIPDKLDAVIRGATSSNDRDRMRALLRSLLFFLKRPERIELPQGDSDDYHSVLKRICDQPPNITGAMKLTDHELEHVASVVTRIEKGVSEKEWFKRSALLKLLDTHKWPSEDQAQWNTAVHAWNCALRNSLGSDGMVLGSLPLGTHVGLSLDPLDKILQPLAPGSGAKQEKSTRSVPQGGLPVIGIQRDPQHFNWAEISQLMKETISTREDVERLRPVGGEAYKIALEDHVKALKNRIAGSPPAPVSAGMTLMLGGIMCIHFGMTEVGLATAIAGKGLTTLNYSNYLKGKWIATNMRRAHKDLEKLIAGQAEPSTKQLKML